MVALARLAAQHGVVCGGTDVDATLEALRGRIDAARAEGDDGLAEVLEDGIREAGCPEAGCPEAPEQARNASR